MGYFKSMLVDTSTIDLLSTPILAIFKGALEVHHVLVGGQEVPKSGGIPRVDVSTPFEHST